MAVMRWSGPFREFAQLQEQLARTFGEAYGRSDDGLMTSGAWVPPVDIYQSGDHELVIKAELPDMAREEIDITVDNGTLTLKGEKKRSTEVADERFHRIERRYGVFSRSFLLPPAVDPAKVGAEYRNGVLTIRLPLRDEAKPRQVTVEVAA